MLIQADEDILLPLLKGLAYLDPVLQGGLVVVAPFDVARVVLFLSGLSAVGTLLEAVARLAPLGTTTNGSAN